MKKYLSILILCFTANFVFASSITVNTHATLVAAAGGTADTIYIDGTIVTTGVVINRNLVLIGINNGTLNGNNTAQIIYYTATNMEFHNLTFINGVDNLGLGGAISTYSSNSLIVKNCKFINNRNNNGSGGAIYAAYLTYLLLENCEFRNNYAAVGGGIWVGGTYSLGQKIGNLYVVNCLFDSNFAVQATGGLDTHSWNKVIIFNSAFTNNYSGNTDPAAICLGHNNQTIIVNTTIAKNHSDGGAGGIGLWGDENLSIYNSVLVGNTSTLSGASDISNTPVNYENSVVRMYNTVYGRIVPPVTLATNVNNFANVQPNSIFVDFANSNFYLQDGSVGINSANEINYVTQWNLQFPNRTITSPTAHLDVDGNNRVVCTLDMGAYESSYPVLLPFSDTFCENTTYNFRGRILTTEGIYYDTIPSILIDCDTIIKLNLTKLNRTYYNYRDTSYKCEWYYFGGDSINETGIYVDTLVAQNGCDSIVTLDLLVRPREFDDTLDICVEKLPVTIYDTIFNQNTINGTYIVRHRCATITLLVDVMPRIETLPPDIPIICADDESFILKFPNTNATNTKPPTHYQIIFDNKAITAGFEHQSGEIGNDNEIVVLLPEKIYPDYYNCKIILSDSVYNCSSQEFDIKFPVLYPDSIMQQKWDDVIALLNYHYNGGFEFSAYQWYRNGSILVGETHSYIYLRGSSLIVGDKYSVLITRPDGSQMFSCDFTAHEPRPEYSPYPQVVQNGNSVIIYIKGKARVNIWSLTGVLLQTMQINSSMYELSYPTKGMYLLEILPENKVENRVVTPIIIR